MDLPATGILATRSNSATPGSFCVAWEEPELSEDEELGGDSGPCSSEAEPAGRKRCCREEMEASAP